MNEKTKFIVVGVVAMLAVAGIGIAVFTMLDDDSSGEVNVTDSLGRVVKLPKNPSKIVCQDAGTLRLVSYFGQVAVDKVVGIDKGDANQGFGMPANYNKATYRLAFPEIVNKTYVGTLDNIEAVKSVKAEVVITSKTDAQIVNNFQAATGIPVVSVNIMYEMDDTELGSFNNVIKLVGKVLGMDARADKLVKDINTLVTELKTNASKVKANEKKTAYVGGLFYMMAGGIYNTTGHYSAFDLTGVTNTMANRNNLPYNTDKEGVKAANPDFIFMDLMNAPAYKTAFATDKAFLQTTKAVSQGKIYSTMFYKYYGTNWENQLINAFYVGSIVYPEYFSFSDEKANNILKVFYGDKLTFAALKASQSPGTVKLSDW